MVLKLALLLLALALSVAPVPSPQVAPTVASGHYNEVKWQPPAGHTLTDKTITYTVYRGNAPGMEGTVPVKQGMGCMLSYSGKPDGYCHWYDWSITHGKTYVYSAKTCYAANPGSCSATVEAKPIVAK
jgi:hypothetical protein